MKVTFEDNVVCIEGNKIVVKYPIKKIEEIANKIIVLLKIPRVELGIDELNNILCYDENGLLCWQIDNKLPSDIVSKEQVPYVAIQIIDDKLYATDFWGRKFEVNVKNGSLLSVKTVR